MYHTHHYNSTAHFCACTSRRYGWRTTDLAIYCKESAVCGHRVFERIWTPVVGEVLTVAREVGNTEDRFAIVVTKDDMVVGHVPREFLKLCWHFVWVALFNFCLHVPAAESVSQTDAISTRELSWMCETLLGKPHSALLPYMHVSAYITVVKNKNSRALIKKYALISEVRLLTRVYGMIAKEKSIHQDEALCELEEQHDTDLGQSQQI